MRDTDHSVLTQMASTVIAHSAMTLRCSSQRVTLTPRPRQATTAQLQEPRRPTRRPCPRCRRRQREQASATSFSSSRSRWTLSKPVTVRSRPPSRRHSGMPAGHLAVPGQRRMREAPGPTAWRGLPPCAVAGTTHCTLHTLRRARLARAGSPLMALQPASSPCTEAGHLRRSLPQGTWPASRAPSPNCSRAIAISGHRINRSIDSSLPATRRGVIRLNLGTATQPAWPCSPQYHLRIPTRRHWPDQRRTLAGVAKTLSHQRHGQNCRPHTRLLARRIDSQ